MYKKVKDTEFGIGEINDEHIIAPKEEFNYRDNVLVSTMLLPTFEDEQTGIILYNYNDKLVTIKELRREYLKDYYGVRD